MLIKIKCIHMMLLTGLILFFIGCSGGGNNTPLLPEAGINLPGDGKIAAVSNSHTNWGLWQFMIDPEAKTMDIIRLRTGAMHINVLPFLDQPPLVYLSLESLQFNGDIVEAGIGLRHPFLGLTEFTGFDVKGILISDGSIDGFTDPDINIPGEGDTRLLNPDGFSRWWNPTEFPQDGTIFGYFDGALGAPDSFADYSGILNGYKYFCDDLDDIDDPLTDIDPEGRGVFSPGQKNTRLFTIQLGDDGLIFNYAVDASWQFPSGSPPWSAPDDFPEGANQPEGYRIEVTELDNGLYFDPVEGAGGNLHMSVDVYDWFGADLHTVKAEWPSVAIQAASTGPTGGGIGYSTYEVELIDCTPTVAGAQDILITVESEAADYQNFIPGAYTSSYFIHTTDVSGEAPATGYNVVFSDEGVLAEQRPAFNDISPALCIETDGDIKMAYNSNQPIDYAGTAYSYSCKSSDGLSWYNFYCPVSSGGGMWACHGDETKIIANTAGNSWRTIHLYSQTTYQWATPFTPSTESPYDGGIITTYITRQPEIIQDADGYVYILGDRNNILQFKKSEVPNSLDDGPSGSNWQLFPIYNIGTGYFSRARSIELAPDDNMYFVYYVNDTSNVIRLAYNTDSTGLTWDTSTIVYDGSTTGTTGAHDPGLDIDPDGNFHVTFVRESDGNNQLCYVYSADGSSWTDPVVISEMAVDMNDDPICFFEFDDLDFLATVWMGGTHIYVSFSYDGGDNWAEAVQVDSLLDENEQPDFVVTADGVMHIAWAALNGNHYDIHYRNAWLEES